MYVQYIQQKISYFLLHVSAAALVQWMMLLQMFHILLRFKYIGVQTDYGG